MKPTLQLQIGQHLTMTPQLQQAIRLLQLSTLELQSEIQEALDSNPMLETADDDGEAAEKPDDTPIDYAAVAGDPYFRGLLMDRVEFMRLTIPEYETSIAVARGLITMLDRQIERLD